MKLDITKIANIILYMVESKVLHLNDKKLAILLFLIDFEHLKNYDKKIFEETYIKDKRAPKPETLSNIFNIMINNEDLDEDDERLYIIQELLDHLDIEILDKTNFTELNFIKMEEDFDKSLFTKKELETITKIIELYKTETARKMANISFGIEEVRTTKFNKVII